MTTAIRTIVARVLLALCGCQSQSSTPLTGVSPQLASAAGATVSAAGSAAVAPSAGAAAVAPAAAGTPAAQAAPGPNSFTAIYKEIIKGTGCTGSPICHTGPAGKLQMSNQMAAYQALVGVSAMGMNQTLQPPHCADSGLKRVVPGDPDNSLLMLKVLGKAPCGAAMPPNPPLLSQDQSDRIRAWIVNGAPND
jgi:hypothetical protein